MRKRAGVLCVVLGGLCILSALGLALYNEWEEQRADRAAQEILPELQSAITQDSASETLLIEGREYIGYLSIPALELSLPVQSGWSYDQLRISPCRYVGSAAGGDLVIAGHNYQQHFAYLSTLRAGDEVWFTDAAGRTYRYAVAQVDTLAPTAVEEMVSGDWALTLFTCNYSGRSRVTVRCSAVETEP